MKNSILSPNAALLAAALMIALAFTSNAQTKKKDVAKNVPQTVLDAFKKTYPNAVIKGSGKEVEEGKTFYEIESVDGKVKRDLLYLPDGKAVEIEEKISHNDLPAVVKETIRKESPKGKISSAEKVTKDGRESYELVLIDGRKTSEIVLDKEGRVVKKEVKGTGKEKEENEENE